MRVTRDPSLRSPIFGQGLAKAAAFNAEKRKMAADGLKRLRKEEVEVRAHAFQQQIVKDWDKLEGESEALAFQTAEGEDKPTALNQAHDELDQ